MAPAMRGRPPFWSGWLSPAGVGGPPGEPLWCSLGVTSSLVRDALPVEMWVGPDGRDGPTLPAELTLSHLSSKAPVTRGSELRDLRSPGLTPPPEEEAAQREEGLGPSSTEQSFCYFKEFLLVTRSFLHPKPAPPRFCPLVLRASVPCVHTGTQVLHVVSVLCPQPR